jgi:hypothetical protein
LKSSENVPIDSEQNVPFGLLVPRLPRRNNIRNKDVEHLAVVKFTKCKKGITFEDLTLKFGISKKQSQRKLKECRKRKALFTPEKHKPQEFYPTSLKADVIEYLYNKRRNVPVHPTGVTHSKTPLSNTLELQKAQSFLEVLCLLGRHPLYIHKLHLQLSVAPEYYHTSTTITALPQTKRNKGKQHLERMARADVNFIIYPNGKVMISIASSNNPFKLETDEDEIILFSFLGQVRDRLLYVLNDPRERAIPSIMEWYLSECDINKDIEISDMTQLSSIDIQLKYADRVFRQYVKSLHDKAVYRCEESLAFNTTPLIEALDQIRTPYKALEALENKIDNLAAALVKQLNISQK